MRKLGRKQKYPHKHHYSVPKRFKVLLVLEVMSDDKWWLRSQLSKVGFTRNFIAGVLSRGVEKGWVDRGEIPNFEIRKGKEIGPCPSRYRYRLSRTGYAWRDRLRVQWQLVDAIERAKLLE